MFDLLFTIRLKTCHTITCQLKIQLGVKLIRMCFLNQKFGKFLHKRLIISVLVVIIVLVMILYRMITTDHFIPTSCLDDLKSSIKKQNHNGMKSLTTFISEQDQVNIEKQIKKDKEMITKVCTSHKPITPILRHRAIRNYNMDENMNIGWCFNAKVNYPKFRIFLCLRFYNNSSIFYYQKRITN